MQEKELEITGGSLYYENCGDSVTITRYNGFGAEAEVPGMIEELPVTVIGKKAFLSKKTLRKIILPDTVEEIGDWAFSYCDNLKEIFLPDRELRLGRTVFMGCPKLEKIDFPGADDDIPFLLAAAVTNFEAYYLLNVKEAAGISEHGEWLEKWDARLAAVLHAPDGEGYSKQVLCGEEDYGSTDYELFLNGKRKNKVRLAFLRLLHPIKLSETLRSELENYLREHTKGCGSEETWQVVLAEHGYDRAYYSLFAELSCIAEDNFQAIIGDIGEDKTEMKAYFMRWKEEQMEYTDFFDSLTL